MAHKKGVGSTDNGRDSNSKRLGVKLFGGQAAKAGNIIIRQRGTKYHPGENVYMGRDFTIHAKVDGKVSFRKSHRNRMYVSIDPAGSAAAVASAPAPQQAPEAAPAPAEETPQPAAAAAPASSEKVQLGDKSFKQDDLKIVEGIGPKIEELLHDNGITTWKLLAESDVEKVQAMLDEAGSNFRTHNPGTWSRQAQLCVDGKWEELKTLQDELDGGKEVA